MSSAPPIFTVNGARSLGMDHGTGALKAGKWADFIVLKEDITETPPTEMVAVFPQLTVWKGKIGHAL
ncbi:Amidohydrolase family protein [Shimia gijangensis]|uniref:Amidohydrolase family protein n=1 Tax=Shimia gijangensis TaxID=1470563 RepID=A0A1M6E5D0_9RHOB|nr:amidohydrolase family protein [Shimia gijangensis]SHI80707.1 Amidohydrolase family protein [Shimia gijangensis]